MEVGADWKKARGTFWSDNNILSVEIWVKTQENGTQRLYIQKFYLKEKRNKY